MEKVLITGGMGFIGSHTVVELYDNGYLPVIIDNLSNSERWVQDRLEKITDFPITFIEADLVDFYTTKKIFEEHNFRGIIHFAASKAVGESVEKPLLYYENNLVSLMNLLKLCADFKVNKFIFSSSCTVYGQPTSLPVDEASPTLPAASPYGNTKQIGEEIIRDFCKSKPDFHAISLRYFNPVGAHKSALIGELPLGVPGNLVPFITQTAAGMREKLSVFGGDYHTPDGTCIRDFIHVMDLADAHIQALKYSMPKNQNYEVFNIGTGKGYSVLEVIKTFEDVSGRKLNFEIVERRAGDVEKIYADPSKAMELLNWKPKYDLKDMLKSAWEWQQALSS